jgi:hypothetical protein
MLQQPKLLGGFEDCEPGIIAIAVLQLNVAHSPLSFSQRIAFHSGSVVALPQMFMKRP